MEEGEGSVFLFLAGVGCRAEQVSPESPRHQRAGVKQFDEKRF